jgi:hypothetical protein
VELERLSEAGGVPLLTGIVRIAGDGSVGDDEGRRCLSGWWGRISNVEFEG